MSTGNGNAPGLASRLARSTVQSDSLRSRKRIPRTTLVEELLVVGVGDMVVSNDPERVLITYGLGSCLGIAVYDAKVRVGGLLHVMLPMKPDRRAEATSDPYKFVESGVPLLFKACYELGAAKSRLELRVAGGARVGEGPDSFQIGKRNFLALKNLLWRNGVLIKAADVGGKLSRTMEMSMATGDVSLRIQGKKQRL